MEEERIHVYDADLRLAQATDHARNLAGTLVQFDGEHIGVKKQREARLLALATELSSKFAGQMTGKEEEVLVEKVTGSSAYGYTRNYVRTEVLLASGTSVPAPGDIIRGTVTGSNGAEIVLKN